MGFIDIPTVAYSIMGINRSPPPLPDSLSEFSHRAKFAQSAMTTERIERNSLNSLKKTIANFRAERILESEIRSIR